MFRGLVSLVVILNLCDLTQADEVAPLPKDVPPILGRAVVSEPGTGKESSEWRIRLSLPRIAWEVVGEIVPKTQWPELKAEVQSDTLNLRMGGPSALTPSRVLDLRGNELSRDQILARLVRETPVLVSVSGRMPDAYFLQLTQPDALLILLGPRDGAPAPQLLAARKDKASVPTAAPPLSGQPVSRIEFRWAERSAQPDRTEPNGVELSCLDGKAYLHLRPILSNSDVADIRLRNSHAPPGNRFLLEVYLTADGAKKIADSCKMHRDKPLVVLLDGVIVAAMIVKTDLVDFVPIAGHFTEAEAQRIVRGILGRAK